MKKLISILILFNLLFACKKTTKIEESTPIETYVEKDVDSMVSSFAIVIHGGAGNVVKEQMSQEKQAEYEAKLEEAIRVGYDILKSGGTSLDAVERTIHVMENSPLFNSGKGAVLTNEGSAELDASIMDGKTLNAGASAGTKTVKNPISLARKIMENSPHVMLAGDGADVFAKEQGLEIVDPEYFILENRVKALKNLQESEKEPQKKQAFFDPNINDSKFGTVGCVALDKHGNIAAGTSTGGMMNKRWGRVGDSPIIGSGTYANNQTCGVSSTGWGEYFIRSQAAYDVSALMAYKNWTLEKSVEEVIYHKIPQLGGNGGMIAIDKYGNITAEFNTSGMFRASMNDQGKLQVAMFKKE